MPTCKYCDTQQPEDAFEVCRVVNGKSYRRRRCHRCKIAAQRDRRAALRIWLTEYKKTLQCSRCGFDDHRALQFHHREGEQKVFNVGDMVRLGISLENIKAEIAKCYVLCANCHHIEHHNEMQEADS